MNKYFTLCMLTSCFVEADFNMVILRTVYLNLILFQIMWDLHLTMPPCRRSQTLPMLSNFCSSPFFLGLLVGFCFHIYSTEFGQGRQEDIVVSSSDVISETKQAFIPILNTFKEKDKDESEKVFVRPRFVKVSLVQSLFRDLHETLSRMSWTLVSDFWW